MKPTPPCYIPGTHAAQKTPPPQLGHPYFITCSLSLKLCPARTFIGLLSFVFFFFPLFHPAIFILSISDRTLHKHRFEWRKEDNFPHLDESIRCLCFMKSPLVSWYIKPWVRRNCKMMDGACVCTLFVHAAEMQKRGSLKSFYPKRWARWILMLSSCIQGSPFISPCSSPRLPVYKTLPLNSLVQRSSDATKSKASSHPSSAVKNAPRDSATELASSASHIDQGDVIFLFDLTRENSIRPAYSWAQAL